MKLALDPPDRPSGNLQPASSNEGNRRIIPEKTGKSTLSKELRQCSMKRILAEGAR